MKYKQHVEGNIHKGNFPNLAILHKSLKWEVHIKECWMKGKVLKAVGDINDITCIFFFCLVEEIIVF